MSATLPEILARLAELQADDAALGADDHLPRALLLERSARVWRMVPTATDLADHDQLGPLLTMAAEVVARRSYDAAIVCRVMAATAPGPLPL